LAELEVVDMRGAPMLVDEAKFMRAAVEAAHPRVGFYPDTDVQQGKIVALSSFKKFGHVAPVHEEVADGAGHEHRLQRLDGLRQEVRELRGRHLAGRHREFAMCFLALA